ncbi:hypothetical protein BDP55DRAFT_409721 [Colletotrichum godetiae]|uniref:Uncharacterized protein n=1 Tax=Colletotrichum godetiae TaxID=1209918 RepID=A0AAJ0ATF8_9PEZI|nr:uncharacterized protein BDP55DRAFT_409721 [Colletotrichum godetiae]KAK1689483.1 hypothetical protein BDP55DRAFT_409721 [Colletotrichum godetiae]
MLVRNNAPRIYGVSDREQTDRDVILKCSRVRICGDRQAVLSCVCVCKQKTEDNAVKCRQGATPRCQIQSGLRTTISRRCGDKYAKCV